MITALFFSSYERLIQSLFYYFTFIFNKTLCQRAARCFVGKRSALLNQFPATTLRFNYRLTISREFLAQVTSSQYTDVVLFFFSFFSSARERRDNERGSINKSPAVYILSCALDGL